MNLEVNGILVAAHELKAPLALMRQLALGLDPANPQLVETYQKKLVQVSERTLRQVNDLARVARLEDGLFEMEPVAVRGVAEAVSSELTKLFNANSRTLNVKFTNRQRLAVANHDLLYSIIYNFCTNAIKYSSADTASRLVVKDYHQNIRIVVRDFGPALPSNIYSQLKSNALNSPVDISFRPDSSGLGLYISAQFAKFMRARLGAVRHRDGTSFFLDLPVSQQGTLFA